MLMHWPPYFCFFLGGEETVQVFLEILPDFEALLSTFLHSFPLVSVINIPYDLIKNDHMASLTQEIFVIAVSIEG